MKRILLCTIPSELDGKVVSTSVHKDTWQDVAGRLDHPGLFERRWLVRKHVELPARWDPTRQHPSSRRAPRPPVCMAIT